MTGTTTKTPAVGGGGRGDEGLGGSSEVNNKDNTIPEALPITSFLVGRVRDGSLWEDYRWAQEVMYG